MGNSKYQQSKLYLNRYCGEEVFPVEAAFWRVEFDALFQRDHLHLSLFMGQLESSQIGENSDNCIIRPHWELYFPLFDIHIEDLKPGVELELPYGYVDFAEDFYALFTYYEKVPSFKNKMWITKVKNDKLLIKISATTDDVEFYDGSRPVAQIHTEVWFSPIK